MSAIPKWLLEQGGLWGVIALCLGAVVLYLERARMRSIQEQQSALLAQVAQLLEELSESKKETADEKESRRRDAQLYAKTVTVLSRKFRETVHALARWPSSRKS